MQDIFTEVLTEVKKDFTRVKESLILNTLKNNPKAILYNYSKNKRGDVITFYRLHNNRVLKSVYVKNNGDMLLNALKNKNVKMINLSEVKK